MKYHLHLPDDQDFLLLLLHLLLEMKWRTDHQRMIPMIVVIWIPY